MKSEIKRGWIKRVFLATLGRMLEGRYSRFLLFISFLLPCYQSVEVSACRVLEYFQPELRQHRDYMLENICLQMLIGHPCGVCREKVELKGQSLRCGLQLAYHECHILVHALVAAEIDIQLVAQDCQVYNRFIMLLQTFQPASISEPLLLLGRAETD